MPMQVERRLRLSVERLAQQWFSAPSGNTISYTFDGGGLKNGGVGMIINNPAFYNASPMFSVRPDNRQVV